MRYLIRKNSLSHFSSGDAWKKEISAIEGYKDIRKHLISKFMPYDKQNEWNSKIEKLYAGVYLKLAIRYKDKKFARECYQNLKVLYGGLPELNLQIDYYKLVNPIKYYYLRILRKLGFVK